MTTETARNLVASLNWTETKRAIACRTVIEGDRIVFCSIFTERRHSISITASEPDRVIAHWRGFIGRNPGLPAVGTRVSFPRGMFGRWPGVVVHVGHRRTGPHAGLMFLTVKCHRRNGSAGLYKVSLLDAAW